MKPLLLVGGGGHCRSCIDAVESAGVYRINGLIERKESGLSEVLGYPVVGSDDDLPALVGRFRNAVVAVGQVKTALPRVRAWEQLVASGATIPVIVSALAHVSRYAEVGDGTVVLHRAIVNAGATVGHNCIVNSFALVEHDAVIGDHCHVATGAILNGGVHVGDGSFIGSGVVVREGVRIGQRVVISAGQVVFKDVPSDVVIRADQQ